MEQLRGPTFYSLLQHLTASNHQLLLSLKGSITTRLCETVPHNIHPPTVMSTSKTDTSVYVNGDVSSTTSQDARHDVEDNAHYETEVDPVDAMSMYARYVLSSPIHLATHLTDAASV